jgi:hypothetical protein
VPSLMDGYNQIETSHVPSSNSMFLDLLALRVSEMLRSHHMSLLMDGPDELGISHILISTFRCNSKGFTLCTFSRSNSHEGSPSLPNRSNDSRTSGVESSLPVDKYHPSCGFITPLHLLSLVTWSSNSLTFRSIQRSEIGPPDTISPQPSIQIPLNWPI